MDCSSTAIATGRYGAIEGAIADRVVFGHYQQHGDWSAPQLDLVCEQLKPAILIDVGKLLEYEKRDGKTVTSRTGEYLRHPFTGVALAQRFDLPDEVCHIIATHAKEGSLGRRSTESWIVHHADFLSFEPFKDRIE